MTNEMLTFNPVQARVTAGALFVDERDRLLLVCPTYKTSWDIPGGYVEPGETPREACQREIWEEVGIERSIGGLLVVDWAPHADEGNKVQFVFDGGLLSEAQLADIRVDGIEISDWDFFTAADADRVLSDRLARRLSSAMTARRKRQTLYVEHGLVVSDVRTTTIS